ncbi:MAG: hypothetical protein WEG36_05735 [Gemmatimonadota bacterium]
MDFPVELLFVLFFLLASVLDAVGRSKKKKRRIEEMDRDERAEADQPMATAEGRRTGVPGRQAEAPRGTAGPRSERAESSRETAETMIPDQLWEILTGTPAPSRGRTPPVESPVEASLETESLEKETLEEKWSEPVPFEDEPRKLPSRFGLPSPTRPRPRFSESLARGLPEEGGRLIASGTTFIPSAVGGPRRVSPYTKLLVSAHPGDLRSAIVLAEILGPPVAFRDPSSPTSLLGPSS